MAVTIRLEADWGMPPCYIDEGDGLFDMYEVSKAVNSVRNNSGELVTPINPR